MMLFWIMTVIVSLIVIMGWLVWVDEQIENPKPIPQTKQEEAVQMMKLRIADAQWKVKQHFGEN